MHPAAPRGRVKAAWKGRSGHGVGAGGGTGIGAVFHCLKSHSRYLPFVPNIGRERLPISEMLQGNTWEKDRSENCIAR